MVRRCAVLSCQKTEGPFFNFPDPFKDKERCLKWLSASGNPSLLEIPLEKLKNKTVCKEHFEISYFIFKRLNKSAIPTLKLPKLKIPLQRSIDDENVDLTATANQTDITMETFINELDLTAYEPLKENRDGSLVKFPSY